MSRYKEIITQAQEEYITKMQHQLVRTLLDEGVPDIIVSKIMRTSKQLVSYIKNKDKVEKPLLKSNKQ